MSVKSADELETILGYDTIGVVGCSSTPGKAAHDVPKYLLEHGYDVIPVNPSRTKYSAARVYDSPADVEEEIDIVCIFRPSDEVSEIVDAAPRSRRRASHLDQQGIRDDEAAARAETTVEPSSRINA